mgnify:FL=1
MSIEISVLVTMGIYLLTNLCVTVWWMSKVTITLKFVQDELRELVTELKAIKIVYMKREDVVRELSVIEKEQIAIWKKIDTMQEKLSEVS